MQAPNSRHLAAMAVKRPTTQTGGPPAKRAYAGGGTAENVARMLGIVGVEGSPSSTVSFGRAGFAAHIDRVGLQEIAQDLLQAAQQRPTSHLASPSSDVSVVEGAEQRQLEALTGAGIKTEGNVGAAPSASSAGVGAYAARERAVVDCFVAIVQQAAASCTQSQPQLQHQHQHQQASSQHGASAMSTLAAVGGTAAATSDMHDSVPASAVSATLGSVETADEGR